MDIRELYWAAGFLEGEGCFRGAGIGSNSHQVSAAQKEKECLIRLQDLFGGNIYFHPNKTGGIHNWYLSDVASRAVMMTLYPLLSTRRQAKIQECLSGWLVHRVKAGKYSRLNTHCKRGHEYTSENVKITDKGSRQCLACKKMHHKAQAAERKQARHARGLRVNRVAHERDSTTLTLF